MIIEKKSKKIDKKDWTILFFNIIYLIVFAVLYLIKGNTEFMIYIGVVTFFVIIISYLHLKYNFSKTVLIGLSLWGFLHLSGGYFRVAEGILYGYWIFPFLRFDQFVHAFGFGFATLFSYEILKNYFNNINRVTLSIFLVMIGMGWGALNEIIEFIAVLTINNTGVGDYFNNMWDMVFNTLGAVIAVIYINIRYYKKK